MGAAATQASADPRPAAAPAVRALRGCAGLLGICCADLRGRRRLAHLRPHRQRVQPGARGPVGVPADRAVHLHRRPRRGPLRPPPGGPGLPAALGHHARTARLGHLRRLADAAADLRRDPGARGRRRLRKSRRRRTAAGGRPAAHAAAGHRRLHRRVPGGDDQRAGAGRICLRAVPGTALRHRRGAVAPGDAAQRAHSDPVRALSTGRPPTAARSLPAWASCAAIPPSWGRSRWTCSRCSWGVRPRCCRSTHATSCTPDLRGLASCAPRRRWVRC